MKRFRLIFTKDETTKILAEGSKDYCEAKRLELSMDTYNSKDLSVIEVEEKDEINWKDLAIYGIVSFINWFFKDGRK